MATKGIQILEALAPRITMADFVIRGSRTPANPHQH